MESWVVPLLLWPFTRNHFFEFWKPFFLFPKRQSKGARGFIEWLRYTAAHVTRGYQNLLENWIRLYHCLSPISKGPEGICGFVYENQREWKITRFYPHSMDCVIFFLNQQWRCIFYWLHAYLQLSFLRPVYQFLKNW